MQSGIERRVGASCCIERHCAGHQRRLEELCGIEQADERQRRRDLRAVEQRQAFLGRKLHGSNPGTGQSVARGQHGAVEPRRSFADQHRREVRKGCQIAGRSDGALGGNHRMDRGVCHCQT